MNQRDIFIVSTELETKHIGQPFTLKELFDQHENTQLDMRVEMEDEIEFEEIEIVRYSKMELRKVEEFFITEIDFGSFSDVELLGQNRQQENVFARRPLN